MGRRVVITGIGAVTPLGHTVAETFATSSPAKAAWTRSAISMRGRFRPTFAAEVKNFDLGEVDQKPGRFAKSGVNTAVRTGGGAAGDGRRNIPTAATARAWAFISAAAKGAKTFGPIVGAKAGADESGLKMDLGKFAAVNFKYLDSDREANWRCTPPPGHVADEFDLCGPNFSCLTACAASAQALGEAAEFIRHGDADIMLAGGSHSMIHPFGVTGFNR